MRVVKYLAARLALNGPAGALVGGERAAAVGESVIVSAAGTLLQLEVGQRGVAFALELVAVQKEELSTIDVLW